MSLPFPNIDPVALRVGSLELKWYAISYVVGILFVYFHFRKISRDLVADDIASDLLTFWVLGVILGGRLAYILFYNFTVYYSNPLEVLKIWNGGMSFHGGLIGVLLVNLIFARAHGISYFSINDRIVCSVPFAIFGGRVANFINGELFGRVTDISWGVIFPHGGDLPRHPSQLYEALGEGVLMFVIMNWLFFRTDMKDHIGLLSGVWLCLYSSIRMFLEFYREPDAHLGFIFFDWVTMGHLLSFPMFVLGVILIIFSVIRHNCLGRRG